jgi:dihydroorotase
VRVFPYNASPLPQFSILLTASLTPAINVTGFVREAFQVGALDKLKAFASFNGPDFY